MNPYHLLTKETKETNALAAGGSELNRSSYISCYDLLTVSSEKGIQKQYKPSVNPPDYCSINKKAHHRFFNSFFAAGRK